MISVRSTILIITCQSTFALEISIEKNYRDNMENTMIQMPEKNPEGINAKMKAGHIGLRTRDYEGTINWYVEKLGFRIIKQWEVGELKMTYLAPANDDSFWLEVLCDGMPEITPDPSQPIISGFQHFCIEVESVDETLSVMLSRDVKVLREPFNVAAIGKRCGFIADLYGNVIEFTENI
jgi:lactoylglutathione lyase